MRLAPYTSGETVHLRRLKGWKFGPLEVISSTGVDYRIRPCKSKITAVHYDWLKRSYAPVNRGNIVCPDQEQGADQVVYPVPANHVQPNCDNVPLIPQVRHRNLRQNVHLPTWFGFAAR